MADNKPHVISPAMMKAITACPLPNFHQAWQEYIRSDFRREWLRAWAGEDIEKRRAAQELLDETTPM